MSLFKFGDFEAELDFTDADVLDSIDAAYEKLMEELKGCPKEGKVAEIIDAQNACYDKYYNSILGSSASELMFGTSRSFKKRLDAADELRKYSDDENDALSARMEKYQVNKPKNREQRRNYQKQQRKNGNNRKRG